MQNVKYTFTIGIEMAKAGQVVSQLLLLIVCQINMNAAYQSVNAMSAVSQLFGDRSKPPIIVVVRKPLEQNSLLRSGDQNNNVHEKKILNDAVDEKKAIHYVNEILRSTGNENDPDVQATNDKFNSALRARCELKVECVTSCKVIQQKKKKNSCEKSCKDVFDYLTMCPPKKPKKPKNNCDDSCEESNDCKQSDSCEESEEKEDCPCCPCNQDKGDKGGKGGWGKTMPPRWR